jgi:hypothetical protein
MFIMKMALIKCSWMILKYYSSLLTGVSSIWFCVLVENLVYLFILFYLFWHNCICLLVLTNVYKLFFWRNCICLLVLTNVYKLFGNNIATLLVNTIELIARCFFLVNWKIMNFYDEYVLLLYHFRFLTLVISTFLFIQVWIWEFLSGWR